MLGPPSTLPPRVTSTGNSPYASGRSSSDARVSGDPKASANTSRAVQDRGTSAGGNPKRYASGEVEMNGQAVSAQPLFNGLLLISLVANVYLIFWLKNLRTQFHDMIAAKRMAASNEVSA